MKIAVKTDRQKAELGDLFGIFFEDINHAADGGLYGELVRNRSFEFDPVDSPSYMGLTAWKQVGENDAAALRVVREEAGNEAVSSRNPHYLEMQIIRSGCDAGIQNIGYNKGIPLQENARYYFSCYARKRAGTLNTLSVSLRSKAGSIYTAQPIEITEEWKRYELRLQAPQEDFEGRLAITAGEGVGTVQLDLISLFPADTYKGRRNGLRKDLAEALEELHPRFMRFPGGCLVHDGALDPDARNSQYRWKNSVGALEERPARRNNWGYNQTLGLGYYEYFQFCEDIGAKPLPVLPGGYDPHHHWAAEGEELQIFIQDALDLIEFANGGTDTTWGAKRAQMGHPEPFGMEYIGIGNEEVGEPFFARFPLFVKAIREKAPEIKIIGTSGPFAAGAEYDRGWQSAVEEGADFVDEHYYQSPEWFIANHHRYDDFSPDGPKVFLGEYASKDNTWYNALAEASFMVGLQNQAPVVGLACYAPLFCNVDYVNWKPDMIWFDNHQIMKTPNYYVQKLFMNYQGDELLECRIDGKTETAAMESPDGDSLCGQIVLEGNEADAEFSNITVINGRTGEVRSFPDCKVAAGEKGRFVADIEWEDYTISLDARETGGWKGFLVNFAYENPENRLFWKLGGWANEDSMIGQDIREAWSREERIVWNCRSEDERLLLLWTGKRNWRRR